MLSCYDMIGYNVAMGMVWGIVVLRGLVITISKYDNNTNVLLFNKDFYP